MPKFKYIGGYGCTYPNILIPGEGSLVVEPGDIRELDSPPDHVWWREVPEDKPAAAKTAAKPAKEVSE